jgi:hypothetical protein
MFFGYLSAPTTTCFAQRFSHVAVRDPSGFADPGGSCLAGHPKAFDYATKIALACPVYRQLRKNLGAMMLNE